MLGTLIQKEIALHLLSVRFVALLLMCALLIPLNFYVNYRSYLQRQIDYQEAVKNQNSENPVEESPLKLKIHEWSNIDPNLEVVHLIFQPTPLSVFATGLEPALPNSLGMTRNGIKQGGATLSTAPIAFLFGHLDFVFVVGTVFSLLALLFTFDAVGGERETGTLRITLANALPRDIFLWSKLIGGYLVFIVPFLLSVVIGLLLLIWQGFPLGEPDVFPRVLCLIFASLLYIAVFFALGAVISIYFESSKTALIVAFTVWVFAVLILPRAGFLAARIVSPTHSAARVYREKSVRRAELRAALEAEKGRIMYELIPPDQFRSGVVTIMGELLDEINEKMAPFEESARLEYRDFTAQLDRRYERETKRQEEIGMTFSRISPLAAFIYLATDIAQTGQIKRDTYFQTGDRYYEALDAEMFSKMSESSFPTSAPPEEIPPPSLPPPLVESTLAETLQQGVFDVLWLCFFAGGLMTAAFLNFFRSEI